MGIKQDIETFLAESGWNSSRLAKTAEVPISSITRLLNGKRPGLNTKTYERIQAVIDAYIPIPPPENPPQDEARA
ncbi:hypothetical protein SAMN04488503_2222 [Humidesulfovibrio mexicanus]|uniref:Helix-turn-helix n=1 Tax=Humidesulfovibrio mexicanus TaxID=147047 RepID=A0A239AVR4_9BACT|nr:hypothetical protein [Humidesulfovibrio mexicanus]SNR99114.1 hypothetical protein SAMN04488503_2222 [Humidesulfovibrio mexicanus]